MASWSKKVPADEVLRTVAWSHRLSGPAEGNHCCVLHVSNEA